MAKKIGREKSRRVLRKDIMRIKFMLSSIMSSPASCVVMQQLPGWKHFVAMQEMTVQETCV